MNLGAGALCVAGGGDSKAVCVCVRVRTRRVEDEWKERDRQRERERERMRDVQDKERGGEGRLGNQRERGVYRYFLFLFNGISTPYGISNAEFFFQKLHVFSVIIYFIIFSYYILHTAT